MKVPDIIGLPPGMIVPHMRYAGQLNDMIYDSMPILKISPLEPQVQGGLEYFSFIDAWNNGDVEPNFVQLLGKCGIRPPNQNHLLVAYQQLSPFSETYTNNYGQSALMGKLGAGVSEGWAEVMFATGGNVDNAMKQIEANGGALGKSVNDLYASLGGLASAAGVSDNAKTMIKGIVEGGKIDFPQIWKGSSWDPSYDISVRLFNPDTTQNSPVYEDECVSALAALMLFATPRSKDGHLWKWPFLCSLEVKGQIILDMAYCRSITVTKGGDDNTVGWNQRSGMIDVKMSFGTLYDVLVASMENGGTNKPRLCKYLANMMTYKELKSRPPANTNNILSINYNTNSDAPSTQASSVIRSRNSALNAASSASNALSGLV